MLPGGSGALPSFYERQGWLGTLAFSPASRVSISELLGSRGAEVRDPLPEDVDRPP